MFLRKRLESVEDLVDALRSRQFQDDRYRNEEAALGQSPEQICQKNSDMIELILEYLQVQIVNPSCKPRLAKKGEPEQL